MRLFKRSTAGIFIFVLLAACSGDGDGNSTASDEEPIAEASCTDDPQVLTSSGGVEFVRTPNACFEDLVDFPYEGRYVEIDGMRQAYVEDGPADGAVVLLLHGQPSWSYLYRKMIPVLADSGYRVIAMDHLGTGRSDKPTDIDDYTYLNHVDRLEQFITALELTDINLFVQDWGSLIGLKVAGENPDWFSSIAVGDGALFSFPEGAEVIPTVENPNEIIDIPSPFERIPEQQQPYYDGCELLFDESQAGGFGNWAEYAMKAASFHASEVLEAQTWFPLSDEEEAAYDAPFPSREYMAGIRKFPSLINDMGGKTEDALAGLAAFEKPFITIWASNDPGQLGRCETQQDLIDLVPGAQGQEHVRLPEASHFLQDDQGEEIARRLIEFYEANREAPPQVGFEILQINSPTEIIVWVSDEITLAEFEALELPEGWAKNQPRESDPNTGSFARSPDASMDGPLTEQEFFGFTWRHNATIIESGIEMDDEGLLTAALVDKYHEVTFEAGSTIYVLVAPGGEQYIRVSRDAGRASDNPTLPDGWQLVEYVLIESLTLTLPNPTLNIRADNQDSFQGPVEVLGSGSVTPGASLQPGYRASLYPTPWPADQANLNRSNSVVDAGLPVGVQPGEVAVESVEMPFPTFAYTRDANEIFVLGGLPTSLEDIISTIDGEAPGDNAFEPHLSRYNPETLEVVPLALDRGTGTPYVGGALIHANGFVYVLSQAYLYKIDAETMDIVEGRQLEDRAGRIYNGLATGRSGELITKYFSASSPTPDSAFLLIDPDTLDTRYTLEAPGATPRLTVHEDESGREFLYHLNTETTFRFEVTAGELVYDDSWVSRYDPYGTGAPNNEPTSPIIVGGRVHYCTNTLRQTSEDPMRIFWQEVEAEYSEIDPPLLGQPLLEGIDTPGWSFFSPAIDELSGTIVGMDMGSKALVALRIQDDGSLLRLWQKNLTVGARPTIVGDRGYVYATDWVDGVDHLVLLDLETGTEILRVPTTATRPTVATIVVLGDEVYYGSAEPGRPTGLFHRFYVP